MTTLWRISDFADLSGEGGRRGGARWHSLGHPIVYLSEHPALALLENIAHLNVDLDDLPDSFQLLEVAIPDRVTRHEILAADVEQRNSAWRRDLPLTRNLGDAWLVSGESCLCLVPSVILPRSTNFLLNPAHPEAKLARIVSVVRPSYDPRLFRVRGPGLSL